MAKGMKLSRKMVQRPFVVDRVGLIIQSLDLPERIPAGFYCRRERAENATVDLPSYTEESMLSDVFHIRIYDCMRDCKTTIYLPIYKLPSEKEEMIMRFINCDKKPSRVKTIEYEEVAT